MLKICYNGHYYSEHEAILQAGNKSYRYGDGFFETIRVWKNEILLSSYHKKELKKV
ncbi:hypothetical protein [Niabella ginsengisoli]|uniref:Branched-chain amino acid aminotransferase n=1 Tax=Niabella ginsengisoli TaxID=522298 RepID=A0ABS9SJC5_9BACT|nr:hypothetical protein [Niabella ginsengisoli]MCH5598482.1 hypothetical protein [Niabella ginsengisoli]